MSRIGTTTYPFQEHPGRRAGGAPTKFPRVRTKSDPGTSTCVMGFHRCSSTLLRRDPFYTLRIARYKVVPCRGRGRSRLIHDGGTTHNGRRVGTREIEETLCSCKVQSSLQHPSELLPVRIRSVGQKLQFEWSDFVHPVQCFEEHQIPG